MRGVILFIVGVFANGIAQAAPVARYGDPVALKPQPALVAKIESAVRSLTVQMRRATPTVDPRLAGALGDLLDQLGWETRPTMDTVSQAIWLWGIVEPLPHIITFMYEGGAEADLLIKLREQLKPLLAQWNYRRFAVAVRERDAHSVALIVGLQESWVVLDPVPRQIEAGGEVTVTGRLLAGFIHPAIVLTTPKGESARPLTTVQKDRFAARLRCVAPGRHQVELIAEGKRGETVLANFPVYCGVTAPVALTITQPKNLPLQPWLPSSAEARLLELLNHDRQAAGLPPLHIDARLTEIARAHAREMSERSYIGHISPVTGNVVNRLQSAGLAPPPTLLENLALGHSPEEIDSGLMESPGHRANALHRAISRVGIGVFVRPAGEIHTVEIFAD